MKKNLFTLAALLSFSVYANAQVGVNTTTPASTLDVVGDPTITTKTDGITAPRITGIQLRAKNSRYDTGQNGTLIYVTAADTAPAGKTINVTSVGYYYYDAPNGVWVKMSGGSASTTEPWQVTGSETLATSNSQNIYQRGLVSIGDYRTSVNLATSALNVLGTGGANDDVSLMSYANATSSSSIFMTKARGTVGSPSAPQANDFLGILSFNGWTSGTNFPTSSTIEAIVETNTAVTNLVPSAIRFKTQDTERLRITNTGNIGIGTATPGNKLEVVQGTNGNSGLRLTNLKDAELLGTNSSGDVVKIKAALPKFFYSPAVYLPTHNLSTGALLTGSQTIDVYTDVYAPQFGGTSGTYQTSAGAPSLPVLPANQLDFYVIYWDTAVFDNVTINAAGSLSYTIKTNAVVTPKSFINIVFRIKD